MSTNESTHLPQGCQQMEINGLPVSQDSEDAIQVHLILIETA